MRRPPEPMIGLRDSRGLEGQSDSPAAIRQISMVKKHCCEKEKSKITAELISDRERDGVCKREALAFLALRLSRKHSDQAVICKSCV